MLKFFKKLSRTKYLTYVLSFRSPGDKMLKSSYEGLSELLRDEALARRPEFKLKRLS